MKTFSLEFSEAFTKGLRADFRSAKNQQDLTSVENLRPTSRGLEAVPVILNPLQEELTLEWPLPQLFRLPQVTLLLTADVVGQPRVYTVDETTWTAMSVPVYAFSDLSTFYQFQGTGPWHVAEFGASYVLSNGVDVVISAPDTITVGAQLLIGFSNSAVVSCCSFRGRAIYGLDLTNPLFGASWDAFFAGWSETETDFNFAALNKNDPLLSMVAWSGIGENTLWPFTSTSAERGAISPAAWDGVTMPLLFEWMDRNDWGFCPLQAQGAVRCVRALRSAVIVYGANGITAMVPASLADAGTFGFRRLTGFGVASRSAVGGDEDQHIFLDKSGYLWRLTDSLELTRLGYREFLDPMLGTEIVISYDCREKDFYISNGVLSFVLTENGLGATGQLPTELTEIEGGLVGVNAQGVFVSNPNTTVSFRTDVMDMGNRDLKSAYLLELGSTGISNLKARVYYRLGTTGEFFVTNWREANARGSVVLRSTGLEFMFEFSGMASGEQPTKIDYLRVHWQQSGKRLIRGI